MFAFGHYYQGVTGMVDTGIFALILGGLYLYTGKNLWIPILAHGVNDTIGFLLIYFNRYPECENRAFGLAGDCTGVDFRIPVTFFPNQA